VANAPKEAKMTIATIPPSNHIYAIRSFISRIRLTRSIPSQQEFAHIEESLVEIEKAINQQRKGQTT